MKKIVPKVVIQTSWEKQRFPSIQSWEILIKATALANIVCPIKATTSFFHNKNMPHLLINMLYILSYELKVLCCCIKPLKIG